MKDLVTVPSAEGPVSSEIEAFIQQMAVELAARYKADISKISVQLKLIKLRDYIRVNFPAEGDEVFRRIIFQAFPNYATAIFVNISNMDNYQTWLNENYSLLEEMSLLERNGSLWEKRSELFGDSAKEIWQHELTAVAGKQQVHGCAC